MCVTHRIHIHTLHTHIHVIHMHMLCVLFEKIVGGCKLKTRLLLVHTWRPLIAPSATCSIAQIGRTVSALSTHGSINQGNVLEGHLGAMISRKKLRFADTTHHTYVHIMYSVDSHTRGGHMAKHTQL